jgi:primosomal protein N' (replication factor Y) (superfamily II helicase)
MSVFADVALPLPLRKSFLYVVPEPLAPQAAPGCRVAVPFRGCIRIGYIVRIRRSVPELHFKCKPISRLIDTKPLFSSEYLNFILKLSHTFYSPAGELLHASFPSGFQVKEKSKISLTDSGRRALKEKKAASSLLSALSMLENRSYSLNYFVKKIGKNGRAAVDSLQKKKWTAVEESIESRKEKAPLEPLPAFQMEMAFPDQKAASEARAVLQALGQHEFLPFLLKASQPAREDIYFALIRKSLSLSQSVLFLQPEIDLTQRFQEKWGKRLGENIEILHSRVSEAEKKRGWARIQDRRSRVVAGPRSALLTPLPDLGLIIVDEEQDDLYFQEDSPVYDARKGAWLRAQEEKAVLVFGSEYPRIEDMMKAEKNNFLVTIRDKEEKAPAEALIIKHQAEQSLLHMDTIAILKQAVSRNKPVLMFTNRRGYAAFVSCRRCRYIPRCENCDIPLMFNRKDVRMVCRYCGFSKPVIHECPRCGSRMMHGRGWGVEAVAEELKKILSGMTVESFFSDVFNKPGDMEKCLDRYLSGETDVLVGTQMLARYIRPFSASLVVVLFPEIILSLPDFRAGQMTYDFISSLKKLAGGTDDAQFIVQTGYPRHHAVAAAVRGDYLSFYQEEINYRSLLNYPPFTIMAEVVFQDRSARTAARHARDFLRWAGGIAGVDVLGPSKAPLSRLRGKHRIQLLIKSRSRTALDKIFSETLTGALPGASVRVYE